MNDEAGSILRNDRNRKRAVRARSINVEREGKTEATKLRLQLADELETAEQERPRTRGECEAVHRPCPFVSCKFNLFLDVNKSGTIKVNFPDLEPDEMPADGSCVLDVADRGGATLESVGELMNVTRERSRQIEITALAHVAKANNAFLAEVDPWFEHPEGGTAYE